MSRSDAEQAPSDSQPLRLHWLRCRLCWTVTLAVFVSILLIEAAILVPSYRNYERDRLEAIEMAGQDVVSIVLRVLEDQPGIAPQALQNLSEHTVLLGMTIRPDAEGARVVFGEQPTTAGLANARRSEAGERFDVRWSAQELGFPYHVEARLDAGAVGSELIAFVWRIIGLVVLIAAFVTVVTMLVLQRLVLHPLFGLNRRLQQAAADPAHPLRYCVQSQRKDELGQLSRAYDELLERSDHNLMLLRGREAELREINVDLDRRVAQRTEQLTLSNEQLQQEVEQRRLAERENALLARIPDESGNPMLRFSRDGRLLYANAASAPLQAHWALGEGGRLPQAWRELLLTAMRSSRGMETEVEVAERSFSIQLTPVCEADYVNVYANEITDRKRYEAELLRQANYDGLTGLPNRALFEDRLAQALQHAADPNEGVAVLLLDLENFKEINGVVGHGGGDALLQEAAQRLKNAVRAEDTVARVGGDVFAVLRSGCRRPAEAAALAEAVIEPLTQLFTIDDRQLESGAGVGIALYPGDGGTAAELIKHADIAMYRAKTEGRNRYRFFVSGMDETVERRQQLVRELRLAVAEEALAVHFQPQLHVSGERVTGMEALVRWPHADGRLISPAEFIPLAEETGLVVPLGAWVLRHACVVASGWDPSLSVAVNLSGLQLQDPALVDTVREALRLSGLAPDRLELEVTETMMMQDVAAAAEVLRGLAELGVHLAVDDFGTGHSSLAYLQRLPIDRLKIDRSFVADVETDDRAASLCDAVIKLGASLGLEVIAEGVETEGQRVFLAEHGCPSVQGFYFARPMPEDELSLWLAQR